MSDSRWQRTAAGDGSVTYRLSSWTAYFEFLETEVFRPGSGGDGYIWRGQREPWSLRSTFDRLLERVGLGSEEPLQLEQYAADHLARFKRAARGRRGLNSANLPDGDWWALGQHFGLATPLLDWTRSPFAAAYFAFEELSPPASTAPRVVFGLHQKAIDRYGGAIAERVAASVGRPASIEFIDPLSDENPRLLSQGGLFTRAPIGVPIEIWVANSFEGSDQQILLRIELPNADRVACLSVLNRMNINHASLFPDLSGATRHVNLRAELEPLRGEGHVRPAAEG